MLSCELSVRSVVRCSNSPECRRSAIDPSGEFAAGGAAGGVAGGAARGAAGGAAAAATGCSPTNLVSSQAGVSIAVMNVCDDRSPIARNDMGVNDSPGA